MTQNSLVFIVDDDPSTRALMTHWIETDAYQVRAFETGEQCLEALQGSRK